MDILYFVVVGVLLIIAFCLPAFCNDKSDNDEH